MSGSAERDKLFWSHSWHTMGIRAWSLLEQSQALDPMLISEEGIRFGLPRMQLRDDAMGFGFEQEPFTLTVFDPFDPEVSPLVRKAIWHRTPDLRRLFTMVEESEEVVGFEPTISVQDASIPRAEFEELLRAGTKFHLPLIWLTNQQSLTDDVGSVRFEFFTLDQPQTKLRLEWSDTTPPSWHPVIEWVAQVGAFLEGCLSRLA